MQQLTVRDPSGYVQDPAVATDAGYLDAGPEADAWDFSIDPTYVSPNSQVGAPATASWWATSPCSAPC